jgi:hypothetical protein
MRQVIVLNDTIVKPALPSCHRPPFPAKLRQGLADELPSANEGNSMFNHNERKDHKDGMMVTVVRIPRQAMI